MNLRKLMRFFFLPKQKIRLRTLDSLLPLQLFKLHPVKNLETIMNVVSEKIK